MRRSSETFIYLYRVIIAALIIASLTLPAFAADSEAKFVGSKKSDKYHYRDCRWAKKIHIGNAIYFDSVQEARKAGYVPCKVCKPPSK